ncbi:MAG TPA: c-type cytochrome [Myxococcaceae bacterium]|nr:c-type cytochrome [Myxococcaceae bacterium]
MHACLLAAALAGPVTVRGEVDAGPSLAPRPPNGARLVPAVAPITEIDARVRDPQRDPLPGDPAAADEIRRGYLLFEDTPRLAPGIVGGALACGNCHLNAGQKEGALPLVGIAAVFPEYNRRSGRRFSLEDRVVGCFLRSLNATGLRADTSGEHENRTPHPDVGAPEVRALAAYLRWLSEGVTAEETRAWRGWGIPRERLIPIGKLDPGRGSRLYQTQCENCHGRDGQGVDLGGIRPGPLWGPGSYNDGAGAARIYTLAGYIRHAMPYTAPGSLTDEQAQHIAAYIDGKPRPAFPGKHLDYQVEKRPVDAVYYK